MPPFTHNKAPRWLCPWAQERQSNCTHVTFVGNVGMTMVVEPSLAAADQSSFMRFMISSGNRFLLKGEVAGRGSLLMQGRALRH